MKLPTKQALGATVAIFFAGIGLAVAIVVWLAATPHGTRWLLETAIPLSGVGFSAKKIEGRIIDHLLLTGVRISLAQQKVQLDTLELRWKPLLLLSGTIGVQELVINGVRIQDDAPPADKPPVLVWPKVSGNARLFDARIERLRISDINYRSLQKQPLQVTSIDGSVSWQDGLLSITSFKGEASAGRLNGSVSACFGEPSIKADLALSLAHPIADMDQFKFQVTQNHGNDPEPFVGSVTIAGSTGNRKLLEISGDMGMARDAVNLRRLRVTRPGQKGVVTADGSLAFTSLESVVSLQVKVTGLDLASDLNMPTDLSGSLRIAGTLDSYKGDLTLANKAKGWQAAVVSAAFNGTREGIKLAPLNATALDGTVSGNLDINWSSGLTLQGAINGRNINPARFDPGWKGIANFRASGKMVSSGTEPLSGSVNGVLLESTLHDQALTGRLEADFAGGNISVARMELHGKGFDLDASGELNRRLVMTARITNASRLFPGTAGTLQADGWVRRRGGNLSGAVSTMGNKLSYAGMQISSASLTARVDEGTGYPFHVSASLRGMVYEGYTFDTMTAASGGTLQRHSLSATISSASSKTQLDLTAGYRAGIWKGTISGLAGSDGSGPWTLTAPAAFAVSSDKIYISSLILTAGAAERFEVSADLELNPLRGKLRTYWSGVNLARANPYMKDGHISGSSHGELLLGILSEKQLTLTGNAGGHGTFTGEGSSITIERSALTIDGGEQGMQVAVDISETTGGRVKGTFSSPAPFRLALPEKGKLAAEINRIDLKLLKPWLPGNTRVEGLVSGRTDGILMPGQRFRLDGKAVLSGGALHQKSGSEELNLAFTSAAISWGWQEEALSGNISLAMAEYGQVRARFQLPVPARFPVAVNTKGALEGALLVKLQEKGFISSFFPGLVRKSFGAFDADLFVGGTWEAPQVGGTASLAKGGAYLPAAGIHLTDVQLAAHLENNLIIVDSFRALSGSGHIEGTARFTLADWKVTGYQGTMRGKKFQMVHLPELRILTSPQLTFAGTLRKLNVRGELLLSEVHFVGAQSRGVIAPSSDVIREGIVTPPARSSPLVLDIQVRVVLGEQVFVKVAGIDAQLGGGVDLSLSSLDRITSKGEIKVTKGRYRTYGVNLGIVRGRLFFAGGPIDNPGIDVLALRSIGSVSAGVTVAGTLLKPVITLYSEPAMPDVDVLAYIVLGHPLGSNGEQASLVNQAAGALLTTSQAEALQNKIKSRLGLSTLEIQESSRGTSGYMGYKPLQVTAPGAIPAVQQPGITETMLTVGKYLTPKLYISYGRSLFTGSNLFLLRYDFFKKWQIETQTGGESGVDLFYKLEFK